VNSTALTQLIKQKAFSFGCEAVGVAKADFLAQDAPKLEQWLSQNKHGEMAYMANYFDIRLDPRKLVPGAKSVISMMFNYYPSQILAGDIKIAKYAYGKDYHKVIKKKINALLDELRAEVGDFTARSFVDSAPVMERSWAVKAGLGWMGKNTLLINKQKGSFYFLAEIITDLALEIDFPFKTDHCGTCTACIDACPTNALDTPFELDASKCISYFTIELKDSLPKEMKGNFENWAFGCDICQDVCPWNRKSVPHSIIDFEPNETLVALSSKEYQDISVETFDKAFMGSAVKRTKFEGFSRNLSFLKLKAE
jgi:epoxyqueuosine reductase